MTIAAEPGLSVVIVAFRSGVTLPGCLAALRRATPAATELIVVDNGAESATTDLVRACWPDATVIHNPVNVGFAAAVNRGVSVARGRHVLLLNPDAEPERDALKILTEVLVARRDAGIVAPRLLDSEGQTVLSCYPFLTLATVAWRHFQIYRVLPNVVLGRYRPRALQASAPFRVDWAQGACLLIRREVFEQIGPLDERFFLYCEEVDLCRRALRAGWRTCYVPAARVRHAEGGSSRQVVPLKLASHYFSKLLYFDKHAGPGQTNVLRLLLLVDLALRIVYRLFRPAPDARERIVSYRAIARALLADRPARIVTRWRALGASSREGEQALPANCRLARD